MRTNNSQRLRHSFALVVAVAAATLFTACDTSKLQSGIEGTGITNAAAIAAVSRGPIQNIDALGVAVNGVSWSAANAETFIDGTASNPSALKPGMMATVQGERAASDRGIARVIKTQLVVRGPILEINVAMDRLNVLGQTIAVDRRTNLDVPGASLAALAVGQIVTVSGFVAANGEVRATRVATPTGMATQDWVVNGTVTAVDTGVHRFAMNGLEVAYTVGLLVQLPSIEIGQPVTVSGAAFTDDGALVATSIAPYDTSLPATAGETVLSGMIARIEGNSISFWTQRIVLSPGTVLSEPLAIGSYIRVTGTMRGGVLYASDVLVLGSGTLFGYLVGYVENVDVAARTLTMFGIEFNVSQTVRLGDFAVGDRVRVIAYRNRFVSDVQNGVGWPNAAERLVLIEGELGNLSPPVQFTLHGVADWTVQVESSTLLGYHWLGDKDECYAIPVSAERFWELAGHPKPPGVTTVWVWGRFEGGIVLATAAGICFPSLPLN